MFLTRATDSNLVDDVSPRCPRVIPYALVSYCGYIRCGLLYESRDCIEGGEDLVPISWSAFGRTVRVGVDGCLTGHTFFITRQLEAGLRGEQRMAACNGVRPYLSLQSAFYMHKTLLYWRPRHVHNIQGSIGWRTPCLNSSNKTPG